MSLNRRNMLSGIAAAFGLFIPGKLLEAKPDNPIKKGKWKELDWQNYLRYKKSLQNIDKAINILKEVTGFTDAECQKCRKAIAKRLPSERDFETRAKEGGCLAGNVFWQSPTEFTKFWCALQVTFRSGGLQDGFVFIDVNFTRPYCDIDSMIA